MALLNLHNIIVNTINLLNITCTLVAKCTILGRLEGNVSHTKSHDFSVVHGNG